MPDETLDASLPAPDRTPELDYFDRCDLAAKLLRPHRPTPVLIYESAEASPCAAALAPGDASSDSTHCEPPNTANNDQTA